MSAFDEEVKEFSKWKGVREKEAFYAHDLGPTAKEKEMLEANRRILFEVDRMPSTPPMSSTNLRALEKQVRCLEDSYSKTKSPSKRVEEDRKPSEPVSNETSSNSKNSWLPWSDLEDTSSKDKNPSERVDEDEIPLIWY